MNLADYPFNDDLLLNDDDRSVAKQLYPHIYEALDHPELRAVFTPIDNAANDAKSRSRRWGLIAVALVAGSLFAASTEPLYHDAGFAAELIAGLSAVAGTLGACLGLFGVLFAGAKRRWLQNRLITERLRQFHFQSIVALAPEILAAAESGDWARFRTRRSAEFARFTQDVIGRVSTVYDSTVAEKAEQNAWLFSKPTSLTATPFTDELLAAYKRLRIDRQLQYATYKLRTDRIALSSMPSTQARWLDAGTFICVLALIGLHVIILPGVFFHWPLVNVVPVLAIWLAIGALAFRTIEEGLKPHLEIERYRHYRSGLENIEHKFRRTNIDTKLATMTDLEQLSFDEMVNFLKSNQEARFVM